MCWFNVIHAKLNINSFVTLCQYENISKWVYNVHIMYLFMVPTYFDSGELNNGFDWIFELMAKPINQPMDY